MQKIEYFVLNYKQRGFEWIKYSLVLEYVGHSKDNTPFLQNELSNILCKIH